MNIPHKLAIAINSWLTYEEMCKRGNLFSEKILTVPIGQFLSVRYEKVIPEFPHPAMRKNGPGDVPRIDFVVKDEDNEEKLLMAIETKWISKSPTLVRDIIRDVVRLAIVKNLDPDTFCYLVIAGRARDFDALSERKTFQGHSRNMGSGPILPIKNSFDGRLRLDPMPRFRTEILKSALKPFSSMELPSCIHTRRFGPFPEKRELNSFVTYLWRIGKKSLVSRFRLTL